MAFLSDGRTTTIEQLCPTISRTLGHYLCLFLFRMLRYCLLVARRPNLLSYIWSQRTCGLQSCSRKISEAFFPSDIRQSSSSISRGKRGHTIEWKGSFLKLSAQNQGEKSVSRQQTSLFNAFSIQKVSKTSYLPFWLNQLAKTLSKLVFAGKSHRPSLFQQRPA